MSRGKSRSKGAVPHVALKDAVDAKVQLATVGQAGPSRDALQLISQQPVKSSARVESAVRAVGFPRFAYMILGMHRSGTSALAGTLSLLGADCPKTLMAAMPDNPKGYFESSVIKVLNDRILNSAGTRWDDWAEFPAGWLVGPRATALKQEAISAIAAEFGTSPLFILKDPRMCRLLPFWLDVLDNLAIKPIHVIMLRNPDEVAASLLRRDKLPESLGRLMWLRHLLDAERWTRGKKRVFTCYDDLLTDRGKMLAALEATSGFAFPRRSFSSETEVRQFLEPQLRRFSAENSAAGADVPEVYQEVFRLLKGLGEKETKASFDRLDGISAELGDKSRLMHGLAASLAKLNQQAIGLTTRIETIEGEQLEVARERDVLNSLVAQKEARIENVTEAREAEAHQNREAIAALEANVHTLHGKLAEATKVTEAQEAEAHQNREAIAALEANVHTLHGKLAEATKVTEAREAEAHQNREAIAALEANGHTLRGKLAEAITARVSDADQHRQAIAAAEAERDKRLSEASALLAETQNELGQTRDNMASALAEASERLDALRAQLEAQKSAESETRTKLQDDLRIAKLRLQDTASKNARLEVELANIARISREREAVLVQKSREAITQERLRIQLEFRRSHSWRLTAPLRWLKTLGR